MKAIVGKVIQFDHEQIRLTSGSNGKNDICITVPVIAITQYVGQILEIRDLRKKPLSKQSIHSRQYLRRSRYLITVQTTNGVKRFYNFNMKRPQKVGVFGWLSFRAKIAAKKIMKMF